MTSTALPPVGTPVNGAAGSVGTPADLALAIAQTAAGHVPAPSPLVPSEPLDPAGIDPSTWAGAAVCELAGSTDSLVILVGPDLTNVLAESPIGALDLGAALQPAFDAVGSSLGSGSVASARTLEPVDAIAFVRDGAQAVPLSAGDQIYAVLIVDVVPKASSPAPNPLGIEILHGVMLDVTVELGRTRLPVRDLLALTPGSVLELDRAAGSPVDLLVNGRLVARGEVVVIDEEFGLRVTELVASDLTAR